MEQSPFGDKFRHETIAVLTSSLVCRVPAGLGKRARAGGGAAGLSYCVEITRSKMVYHSEGQPYIMRNYAFDHTHTWVCGHKPVQKVGDTLIRIVSSRIQKREDNLI